ncbi:DUF4241 domain-containing protein [Nocardia sp. NPDC050710]|uniref:DUF4241 domain-containing protein n=1 Tax=Nocardia sp. NPDC050710 TaxID=3157220 RepID=UPI0033F74323
MDELRPESREYLDGLFTPGQRIGGDPYTPYSWIDIVDVQEVAVIRLPSGRLVADSPWSAEPPHELALRVPPGTYPVEVSWSDVPSLINGCYFERRECAATRLRIRDEPVVTWELVLGVGEDPSGPRADRAGFEAEEAMGCFADATAWESLTAPFRRFLADLPGFGQPTGPGRDTEDLCEGYFELARDEEHRADLLAFGVPEGWAQVWAGRARDGEIAVIVVPGPVSTSPWD